MSTVSNGRKAAASICVAMALTGSAVSVSTVSRPITASHAIVVTGSMVYGPTEEIKLAHMLPDGGVIETTTTTPEPEPEPAPVAPVNPKPAPPVPAPEPVQPAPTVEPPSAGPGGDVSAQIEAVIAFAQAQHGDAYVWGGNGPNGWDCSGLVQAAFRSVGINLPRTTWDMVNLGVPVSRGQLQRGDLVFMESIGHMGIYVGGNMMVNAASGRTMAVVTSSLYAFDAGRRIIY